tara:strand:+ start:18824 stop:19555 length:732 start_codon:yes stop_codon:yes gene_type:complete
MPTVCHQRQVRNRASLLEGGDNLFGKWWENLDRRIETAECRDIPHEQARKIIAQYEYLGTYCNAPIFAHGIYFSDHLAGCVVFGAPSPPNIAPSVMGEKEADRVIQLARGACVHWAHPHSASKLIASGLRSAESRGYGCVIAFSDPDAGEIGTVYQATNWLYCGLTAKRPDYFNARGVRVVGRFQKGDAKKLTKGDRTRKHRYVFLLGNKRDRKNLRKCLRWETDAYPKRQGVSQATSTDPTH